MLKNVFHSRKFNSVDKNIALYIHDSNLKHLTFFFLGKNISLIHLNNYITILDYNLTIQYSYQKKNFIINLLPLN